MKKIFCSLLSAWSLAFFPRVTGAAEEAAAAKKIPFETDGVGVASKFERRIDAEKRAEEDALSRAFKGTGVDVYYGFSDVLAESGKKNLQMVSQYLWTFSRGVAVWEPAGEPACASKPDGTTECRVRLKGHIQLKGRPDPSYEIVLEDGGLSRASYRSGEPVEAKFRLSHESLVYILSVDEEQNTHLLFPNRILRENSVNPGKTFVFPPKDSGISLTAYLPQGRAQSFEMLHIIATKGVPLLSLNSLAEKDVGPYKTVSAGTLGNIMSRLAQLPRDQWTMAVIPYEIRE